MGEDGADTLGVADQVALREAVTRHLPSYACDFKTNDDAMTWAVLTARQLAPRLPRFTICRIAPSVVVMVEDAAERRFSSAATMDDAIAFACRTSLQAVLANHNVHLRPDTVQ